MEGAGESLTKSVSVPMAAAGTAAIKFASESQDAYKQFAAATGTATENLGKYQDMINNVYKDNFGESIGDVADAMAKVDQNMSYLDDSALQRCTEYAYTLADTFDVDIGESTRAADSLIKNFGVSAREAFNLMAQGAQNGLDFSGEWKKYSIQKTIADLWGNNGKPGKNGIATINGYYLIALRPVFGSAGDVVSVVLEDGTRFNAIMADEKGDDAGNQWGHVYSGAVSIVEFESLGNSEANNGAQLNIGQWAGKKVTAIINGGRYSGL